MSAATALVVVVAGFLTVGVSVHATVTPAASVATLAPSTPPAPICGNTAVLTGPATAPAGAVTLPAGDHASFIPGPSVTYWFAPGVHTFGTSAFGQIVPKDGDSFIGGPGAVLDGKSVNRYAFTGQASNVVVKYLTVQNFVSVSTEGVVDHDSGPGWTVSNNTITNNGGAGVFLSGNGTVSDNCLTNNGAYGYSSNPPQGAAFAPNVTLTHNEIKGNATNTTLTATGCGCTGAGKFWRTNGANVTNNWIHNNHGVAIWPDTDNNNFDIEGNYVADNDGEGVFYETSYNARIVNNTFVRNANVAGPKNPGFPTGAIYLSESGGDARVAARYSTVEISGNQFTDNWAGVVAWENADRFCGSPNDTSTGNCTLVNTAQANLSTCVQGTIQNAPYYSDCRWKTQNVSVHGNEFDLTPANIGSTCTSQNSCGLQGLFSNFGTSPTWSPYMGAVIEDAITGAQHNLWANNTYQGPWQFMPHDQRKVVSAAVWQASPWSQDAGSTFNSAAPAPTTAPAPPRRTH